MLLIKTKLFWLDSTQKLYCYTKKNSSNFLLRGYWGYLVIFTFELTISFFFFYRHYLYSLYKKKFLVKNFLSALKSYIFWLQLLLHGKLSIFKLKLQLFGLGKRVLTVRRRRILLTLGYCHNILIYKFKNMWFKELKKRKNAFIIRSSNLTELNNSVHLIRRLRFPDCYNANGIRFVREQIKLKPRKKWGVF